MKITIVCVGKIKEKFFSDAIKEYQKRLSRYCKLEIKEVQDEKTPDRASKAEEDQIKEKEAARIVKCLPDNAYIIPLAINGKQSDSVAFSDKLHNLGLKGTSNIVFIIGGSLGLHESVLSLANEQISFSEMTFPHQLMRVILLEQIYRAMRIMKHEPYHK